ncbi:MAG: endonuclease domain-containing protein [Anaerolineales bacterium]|nr:endonuclease domain-containing protein [Anaerolineales bacterium]
MDQKRPKYHSPPAIRQRAKELRWPMTPAETALWERLKNKQLYGLKFRRQHPLHHFILDFYCHAHKLVIEVDGGIHQQQSDYDEARTEWLTQRDFKVIRFTNEEVLKNIEAVLQTIAKACNVME